MLACGNVCIVLQLTPHLCPAQPVHVQCNVYALNAYEGTKTNSLHLSERYSAEFKQTIEMKEHGLPETVFATFEFSGVCDLMQNTAQ